MLISLWIRDKFFGGCLDILDIGSWGFFWGRLQLLVHIIRKLLSYWRDGGKGISYLSFVGFRALWQNNESFNVSYKSKIRNISQTLRTCWLLTNNRLNKSYTRWQLRSPSNSYISLCCWGFHKFEKKMQNHKTGNWENHFMRTLSASLIAVWELSGGKSPAKLCSRQGWNKANISAEIT